MIFSIYSCIPIEIIIQLPQNWKICFSISLWWWSGTMQYRDPGLGLHLVVSWFCCLTVLKWNIAVVWWCQLPRYWSLSAYVSSIFKHHSLRMALKYLQTNQKDTRTHTQTHYCILKVDSGMYVSWTVNSCGFIDFNCGSLG